MSVEIPSLLGNCNYHLMREINTGKGTHTKKLNRGKKEFQKVKETTG
jgi:hypothetical protein